MVACVVVVVVVVVVVAAGLGATVGRSCLPAAVVWGSLLRLKCCSGYPPFPPKHQGPSQCYLSCCLFGSVVYKTRGCSKEGGDVRVNTCVHVCCRCSVLCASRGVGGRGAVHTCGLSQTVSRHSGSVLVSCSLLRRTNGSIMRSEMRRSKMGTSAASAGSSCGARARIESRRASASSGPCFSSAVLLPTKHNKERGERGERGEGGREKKS